MLFRSKEGAGAVLGADGVGELVEAALLGGEDHGFYVAEGDPVAGEWWGGRCGRRQMRVLRLRALRFAQDDSFIVEGFFIVWGFLGDGGRFLRTTEILR